MNKKVIIILVIILVIILGVALYLNINNKTHEIENTDVQSSKKEIEDQDIKSVEEKLLNSGFRLNRKYGNKTNFHNLEARVYDITVEENITAEDVEIYILQLKDRKEILGTTEEKYGEVTLMDSLENVLLFRNVLIRNCNNSEVSKKIIEALS